MKDSRTPKIVVGVALVAVYAAGLTFLTVRGKHESAIAQSDSAAVAAQTVAAPASAGSVTLTDALGPEASASAVAPAPIAREVTGAKTAEMQRSSAASTPKPIREDVQVANLPSPRPKAPNDAAESSRSNSGSNAVSELPAADSVASESVTSAEGEPPSQDSRRTPEALTSTIEN